MPEDLRGQGYRQKLLDLVEEEDRKRGASYAYPDTSIFWAPDFYKKFDYQAFGKLEDFPPGHTRYFLMKSL